MQIYRVGGFVRDKLLGVEPKDCDYVVVGSTPDQMISLGYQRVGADFPVFLHPVTGDEYALARTERKVLPGYNGFEIYHGNDVTLELDLVRRDLTVNAMALDENDNLIDPFGGANDIRNKILRHVNPDAFADDPVRILRLARFYARFGPDWTIARETINLARDAVANGLMRELTTERVSKEFTRSIMESHPCLFFDALRTMGALADVFPEIDKLTRAIENPKWHPEGDAYEHSMLVLNHAAKTDSFELRLAALVHDFGKGETDPVLMPKHYGHDIRGVPIVERFCKRMHIPTKTMKRMMGVTRYHMNGHRLDQLNPKTFVKMFEGLDAFRDPDVVVLLRDLFVCDTRGRLGSENGDVRHLDFVVDVWNAVKAVKFADVFGTNIPKNSETIKNRMFQARVAACKPSRERK